MQTRQSNGGMDAPRGNLTDHCAKYLSQHTIFKKCKNVKGCWFSFILIYVKQISLLNWKTNKSSKSFGENTVFGKLFLKGLCI